MGKDYKRKMAMKNKKGRVKLNTETEMHSVEVIIKSLYPHAGRGYSKHSYIIVLLMTSFITNGSTS